MADKIDLDKSDRGNIYKEDASNVSAIEMTADECSEFLDDGETPAKLQTELDELQAKVAGGAERRAYLIIKITK